MRSRPYVERMLDRELAVLFRQLPAVLLVGPRAAGKTTLAERHVTTTVHLDREAEAVAFRSDPDAALRSQREPVLLDEWQAVPSVLGAVKRSVDADPRPGRFLLTGSVRADVQAETWPGTGRVVRLRLYGITMRELGGRAGRTFIDRLVAADLDALTLPTELPDLPGYLDVAMRSGFPEALLRLSGRPRRLWLEGYLEQLLTRDAPALGGVRDPARLRRYFEALALNSAGMPHDQTLYTGAGIDHRTAMQYESLLTNLFILESLPAWATNRLTRLVKRPKRYVVDPALVGAALRVEATAILKDGDLLGRILDTLVMAQLRPELEVSASRPRLFHFRDQNGRREVDVIGELATGIVAVEVKATSAPGSGDAEHLTFLRERLGDRFLSGAVLHTGPMKFKLSDRIFAVPIAALWG